MRLPWPTARQQWQAFVTALNKGNRTLRRLGKLLSSPSPPSGPTLVHLAIEPDQKRVFLAAIGKRFPETAKEVLPLARKLDFEPDAVSLCLDKVLR